MIITIPQTDNIDSDLEKLDAIKNIVECFPGNDEVKIRITDDNYELAIVPWPIKVDSDNTDMWEMLLELEGVEVE